MQLAYEALIVISYRFGCSQRINLFLQIFTRQEHFTVHKMSELFPFALKRDLSSPELGAILRVLRIAVLQYSFLSIAKYCNTFSKCNTSIASIAILMKKYCNICNTFAILCLYIVHICWTKINTFIDVTNFVMHNCN